MQIRNEFKVIHQRGLVPFFQLKTETTRASSSTLIFLPQSTNIVSHGAYHCFTFVSNYITAIENAMVSHCLSPKVMLTYILTRVQSIATGQTNILLTAYCFAYRHVLFCVLLYPARTIVLHRTHYIINVFGRRMSV